MEGDINAARNGLRKSKLSLATHELCARPYVALASRLNRGKTRSVGLCNTPGARLSITDVLQERHAPTSGEEYYQIKHSLRLLQLPTGNTEGSWTNRLDLRLAAGVENKRVQVMEYS